MVVKDDKSGLKLGSMWDPTYQSLLVLLVVSVLVDWCLPYRGGEGRSGGSGVAEARRGAYNNSNNSDPYAYQQKRVSFGGESYCARRRRGDAARATATATATDNAASAAAAVTPVGSGGSGGPGGSPGSAASRRSLSRRRGPTRRRRGRGSWWSSRRGWRCGAASCRARSTSSSSNSW